jgi:hypothetical protein
MVMNVLAQQENYPQGLLQYARIALERRLWTDVVRVGLRLMVLMPEADEVKAVLAAALQVLCRALGKSPRFIG